MYKYFIISLLGCAPFWVQAQIQTIQYRTIADLRIVDCGLRNVLIINEFRNRIVSYLNSE